MPNRKKVERSANYSYYSDLLWCTVPLIGMSWYYYGARPVLLLLAALLTAYLCDCALAPLHGTGYQSHEPSSECFAALIALLHDVLLAFFAAVILRLNIDSNFIAVVMTLLGYSLNDTIVVFDRVRENRRHYGQSKSIAEITNISNNQVLSRNIMTSLTTVIAIVTIMVVAEIKGLTSLRTLTIPLTVGLLSGTYSSVCISPGLWVKWQERKARKAAKD